MLISSLARSLVRLWVIYSIRPIREGCLPCFVIPLIVSVYLFFILCASRVCYIFCSHNPHPLSSSIVSIQGLTSKFYYLQIATWEKTYRPEWKELDIMDWVNDVNIDNNHMVKKLAGKIQREDATELDLLRAKNTIRQRMIVGLMTDMEESFNRFNKVLNINEDTDDRYKLCMDLYFGGDVAKKSNSNSHPRVSVFISFLLYYDDNHGVSYAQLSLSGTSSNTSNTTSFLFHSLPSYLPD